MLLPIASDEPLAVAASPSASRKATTGHEPILLAEDDSMVRRLCVRMLEGAGYEVLAAATGVEAIALARQNAELDLALLDVVMPEMTGPQAHAAIRELHPFRNFPCVNAARPVPL